MKKVLPWFPQAKSFRTYCQPLLTTHPWKEGSVLRALHHSTQPLLKTRLTPSVLGSRDEAFKSS